MKYRITLVLTFTLISFHAIGANSKSKNCTTLVTCLNKAAKLLGQKYVYDKEFKGGKISFTEQNYLNKENADFFISVMLNQHNYVRLPLNEKNSFRIIPTREVRYEAVPMKDNLNDIPKNHDHFMYTAKIKHIEAEDISRNFRPFMTKYGRLMEIRKGNKIIISDTGLNIHRLAKLITQLDKPLSKEEQKRFEEEEDKWFEIRKLKAKNCGNIKDSDD